MNAPQLLAVLALAGTLVTPAAAANRQAVLETYADIAHAVYADSAQAARSMQETIERFLAAPSAAGLLAARDAWIAARVPYQQSEVFRFGNAIVDDWEGQVNAWPLDEGLIDYVGTGYQPQLGNPGGRLNIIANSTVQLGRTELDMSELNPQLLAGLNELAGSEVNVATGYHAIEFLLWGQDANGTGPGAGDRPYTDYLDGDGCTNEHCERRAAYLRTVTGLLISDLDEMTSQWAQGNDTNYRATLLGLDDTEGLTRMIFGMGSLALGELAGERMKVALEANSPEDEHDCFSDNTHWSHYYNARGIRNIYLGEYRRINGDLVSGPSLSALVATANPELDRKARAAFGQTEAALQTMVDKATSGMRFDQMIAPGNADGRRIVTAAIAALTAETDVLTQVARAVGIDKLTPDHAPASLSSRITQRVCGLLATAVVACAATPVDYPVASGGATSVNNDGRNAFSLPSANMPLAARLDFSVGNSFFRNPWVIAPASTDARDGLGALYNTNACQNCHVKDGRGHPPEFDGDIAVSMLVRLGIDAGAADAADLSRNGGVPEPVYGGQLQDFAVPGVAAEGQVRITYEEFPVEINGEPPVSLRRPTVHIDELAYGPLHEGVMTSARIAPPMIGLGLLEAIPEATLRALADPDDRNRDGISGRLNTVWDERDNKSAIGRFGWKAGQPTLLQQNAAAFNGDLGITSTLFAADNCTPAQTDCRRQASGGEPELSDEILRAVTFYSRNLAVPARRNVADPDVTRGMRLFAASECAACHVPDMTTGTSEDPWLIEQRIAPYTDLLLHDMGDGLADHRPEFAASGREWRTPPLWGIGLTEAVGGRAYYLHDGRARNLLEAILWHGGEAQDSRDRVVAMSPADRAALLRFLESL